MVNGQTARITRYLVTGLVVLAMILLGFTDGDTETYKYVVLAGLGFLVGTNFSNGSPAQEVKGPETPLNKE